MLAQFVSSQLLIILLSSIIGASIALLIVLELQRRRVLHAEDQVRRMLAEAQREGEVLREQGIADAKLHFAELREEFDRQTEQSREQLRLRREQLDQRADELAALARAAEQQTAAVAARQQSLAAERAEIQRLREQAGTALEQAREQLQRSARVEAEQARAMLLDRLEAQLSHECGELIERRHREAVQQADLRARELLLTTMQRISASLVSSSTVATIDIPSDDLKGRVIGREGRNIRAFEKSSGAEVIVDDTPGVIAISCFDNVRREVAARAMRRLIDDGRIHPQRIEEVLAEAAKEVEEQVSQNAERALLEADAGSAGPRLLEQLGKLHYRTSYGQNVLAHSVEVAILCGLIAAELRLDQRLARRAGLLHDIGKAMDREIEGAHTTIGAAFLERLGEAPEVVNAAAAHHADQPATSIYTPVVIIADSISAARPGARRETLERYLRRMEALEQIARSHAGVSEVYAVQAGRELRILVNAEQIDDGACAQLARSVANRIQTELTYPGEIRVTVIREQRIIEFAR
mgnify:CR=1 FL=1